MNKWEWIQVILMMTVGVCVVMAFYMGLYSSITHKMAGEIKQEAIDRGFAEYNATTGEWQWKGERNEN